ncbi:MAG: molybdopterin molybdotransferase MoeA, partial [Thermomicrobiales bacterium]
MRDERARDGMTIDRDDGPGDVTGTDRHGLGRANDAGDGEHELTVDTAREHILAAVRPLPVVVTPIAAVAGMTLAAAIHAPIDLPPFANAAMDGYALRAADVAGGQTRFRVVAGVAAGHQPTSAVARGTAVRIMTGAPVPAGADLVVRFEDVALTGDRQSGETDEPEISLTRPVVAGQNIRPAGEDLARGALAIAAGTTLTSAHIGLLAALGLGEVPVHRRPVVAVLATGDELRGPGDPLGPAQVHDANGPMLAAMVREAGGEPLGLGIARDDRADLLGRLAAAGGADLIVTAGGVSAGDFD